MVLPKNSNSNVISSDALSPIDFNAYGDERELTLEELSRLVNLTSNSNAQSFDSDSDAGASIDDPLTSSINASSNGDARDLSIEQLSLLLMTDRVHDVEGRISKEFSELKKRQLKVEALHHFMKLINKLTNEKGEINIKDNAEVKALLGEMIDLGVNIEESKTSYNKDERDRLVQNVSMTVETLTVQNDLQIQAISRLTNERYEMFQMIRTIMKPLHEDKLNKARAIAGR